MTFELNLHLAMYYGQCVISSLQGAWLSVDTEAFV